MSVTLHTPETIYSPRHVPSWLLLSCAAGKVNGFAFLMCQQFVTHITGTVTRLGLEWGNLGTAAEYGVVFLSFVAGATTAVATIQFRAHKIDRLRWATPLFSVAVILIAVAFAGHLGVFGVVQGTLAAESPPFVLLSLLAFAMGLQNAAVASTTGLAVRTTHLTGPATDLGIHLGAAFFQNHAERRNALRAAALRLGKIAAFTAGAIISIVFTSSLGFLALLAPAAFILVAAVLSFVPDWSPSDYPFKHST